MPITVVEQRQRERWKEKGIEHNIVDNMNND